MVCIIYIYSQLHLRHVLRVTLIPYVKYFNIFQYMNDQYYVFILKNAIDSLIPRSFKKVCILIFIL